jgi:F0F1-type ATP synthase membrane subunit b/b'
MSIINVDEIRKQTREAKVRIQAEQEQKAQEKAREAELKKKQLQEAIDREAQDMTPTMMEEIQNQANQGAPSYIFRSIAGINVTSALVRKFKEAGYVTDYRQRGNEDSYDLTVSWD